MAPNSPTGEIGTSLEIQDVDAKVIVSPCPFDDYFVIDLLEGNSWKLMNSLGGVVLEGEERFVNTSSLASGVYFIVVNDFSIKMIKR